MPNNPILTIPDWLPVFGIPMAVLSRMTKDEVRRVTIKHRDALDEFEAWNEGRGEPRPTPGFYDGVEPPKSYEEYLWRGVRVLK
jgi:hypothetical protein